MCTRVHSTRSAQKQHTRSLEKGRRLQRGCRAVGGCRLADCEAERPQLLACGLHRLGCATDNPLKSLSPPRELFVELAWWCECGGVGVWVGSGLGVWLKGQG